MKFIENSVEVVKSQEGEGEMASCEMVQVNGEVKSAEMRNDPKAKISNGVHDKDGKNKTETNGFYNEDLNCEDEDFHLVLEASSEDSSPMKNEISAEALTKEITALLDESSEGIDEELKKIDELKSEDFNDEEEIALLNGETLSQSSTEDKASTGSNVDVNVSDVKEEKKEGFENQKKETSAAKISSECDVELEEDILLEGKSENQDLENDYNAKPKEINKTVVCTENYNSEIDEEKNKPSCEETHEISLSQISDMSENDAWTVIDSVETSDDDEIPRSQENKVEEKPTSQEIKVKEELTMEDDKVGKEPPRQENRVEEEPTIQEKKVEEEHMVQENKVEEDLSSWENKLEGETTIQENKVEEEPTSEENKVEEEHTVQENKVEEKPTIQENKVEDKHTVQVNKIEEEPSSPENKLEGETTIQENKIEKEPTIEENKVEEEHTVQENKVEKDLSSRENKLEGETTIQENKVEEEPTIEENKVEEEHTVQENKVEEKPTIQESKFEEELSSLKNKVEDETTIQENKAEEEPTIQENKVKEEHSVQESKVEEELSSRENTSQIEERSRKRSASVDDEVIEQKKVKLDTNQLAEKTSSIHKRFSSDLLGNETKRTRLNGEFLEEDSEMVHNKGDDSTNIEMISEDKLNVSLGKSEVKETLSNSTIKEQNTSMMPMDVTESKIDGGSDAVDKESLIVEESLESTVEESAKHKKNEDVVMEDLSDIEKSSSVKVNETLDIEDGSKIIAEENPEVLVGDKPNQVQIVSDNVEQISNQEINSKNLVKESKNKHNVKNGLDSLEGTILECIETNSGAILEETSDVREDLKIVPETTNVDKNEKKSESNDGSEVTLVKPLLSSDSCKASPSLSDSSKAITSSTTEAKSEVKVEFKVNTNEFEKNTSKDSISLIDESKKVSKDHLVESKMTYKLTPIETNTSSIKKRRASPSNEPESSDTLKKKSIIVNSLKVKPESDPRTSVEENKTYALLEPMKVLSTEELNKQTQDSSCSKASPNDTSVETKTEDKAVTNLDKAIESVVKKSRCSMFMVLKKFHKNQLRKMTRTELEEAVVLKICEAVTDKSELGQMRQKHQSLEQDVESWKKKAVQYEKQIRELDMVVKRFLSEAESLTGQKDSKPPLPIKVTRSVGLQVVLASSIHGQVINKSKQYQQQKQLQQQKMQQQQMQQQKIQQQQMQMVSKQKLAERLAKDQQIKSAATYTPPVQQSPTPNMRKPGRPSRSSMPPAPSIVQKPTAAPNKTTISTLKPVTTSKPSTPVKPTPPTTPVKDLEVIDLTDREEKSKVLPQNPSSSGGGIRVAPQTQVCFVQQSAATTPTQMAYIVQKPGQRQQYLVATSSASPPKPTQTTRPPPALAAVNNVYRTVPSSQPGARTQNSANTPLKSAAPPPRPPQLTAPSPNNTIKKHPAPLPAAPPAQKKPGMKLPPSKPLLKIAKTVTGIMLSWSMSLTENMADMASYQLYAYQESNQPPTTALWKKVGDVKALPLPMACTLTQFIEGHKYHFAVRAVDIHGRIGPFSHPGSILLKH